MKAFAEQFCPSCSRCLLFRVGPDTDQAPKDFDYMVLFTCGDEWKGLTHNPERNESSIPKFNAQHWDALIGEVERLGRSSWRFDRYLKGRKKRTTIMENDFEMTVTITITKGGKAFSETNQQYHNMSYAAMQLVQGTIVKSVVGLGDAKAAEVKK